MVKFGKIIDLKNYDAIMNTEWHHNLDPQSENEVKLEESQNVTKCAKNEKSAVNLV